MAVDIEEPQVQIAGFAGVTHGFEQRLIQDVVAGARVGRGPWAGVVQARVGIVPPLEVMVSNPFEPTYAVNDSYRVYLDDVVGLSASAELGVPVFGARFSGGPFFFIGVDFAVVRQESKTYEDIGYFPSPEFVPALGARFGPGASFCVAPNAALRVEIPIVVRSSSIIDSELGFSNPERASVAGQPNPWFMHQVSFALTVAVGPVKQ